MGNSHESPYVPTFPYIFDLRLFDSDRIERVTVYAENRVRAFSLAALQAESACNVMEVTLIRDDGTDVDRNNQGAGITSPSPYYAFSRSQPRGRIYVVELKFIQPSSDPGELSSSGDAIIFGRPLAFSDAVIESGAPDNVWQASLYSVSSRWIEGGSKDAGEYFFFRDGVKYGDVTVDLEDWL